MFSKACEYAIRASIFIAGKSLGDERTYLNEIAAEIESPVSFTSKILQKLVKSGLITSVRGQGGGFSMSNEQMAGHTVADIVHAIGDDSIFTGCGLGLKYCSPEKPCPIHRDFEAIRNGLRQLMETTTIKELALDLKDGNTFLRRPEEK